jgi:ATP-binding cassette subfamily C (CFTR/MRP) protein 1
VLIVGLNYSQAVAFAIPTLAAVLSFVTYAATKKEGLDPAVIFPSMGLFQMLRYVIYSTFRTNNVARFILMPVLRQPLMFLPRALSSAVDAKSGTRHRPPSPYHADEFEFCVTAFGRLMTVFLAETIETQIVIEQSQEDAVVVKGAEFVWFGVEGGKKGKAGKDAGQKGGEKKSGGEMVKKKQSGTEDKKEKIVFRLADISLNIPRGSLTAIVGPVGYGTSSHHPHSLSCFDFDLVGKSSLLLGLLGEMPQSKGSVVFGGRTAYCAQMAWIQNATLVCTLPSSNSEKPFLPLSPLRLPSLQ